METLWWTSWAALGRIAVLAVTGYAGLLLMLRTAGDTLLDDPELPGRHAAAPS